MLAATLGLPAAAGAVLSGENGRIVFVSGRGETSDSQAKIYLRTVVSSVGGGSTSGPFTSEAGQYRHPTWAPDRRSIAYARHDTAAGVQDVFIHNLVTGTITRISNAANVSDRPAWSPDGTRIAFETTSGTDTDIIVYTIATGTRLNLTDAASGTDLQPAGKPAWGPDSQTLFYAVGNVSVAPNGTNNDVKIYKEAADNGGTATEVVHVTGAHAFQPSISPDGTQICYTLGTAAGLNSSASIIVEQLGPPGSSTVLSSSGNGDYNCTWSPDGTLIAYVSGTFSTGDLVMEPADNSLLVPHVLEDTVGRFDGNPDWAPDGRPRCKPAKAQTVRGGSVFVKLACSDRGPAYERTPVRESVRDQPSDGTLGPVQQGNPARVRYTADSQFTGKDTFTFRGFDDFGFGPHATATVEVLLPGRCANFKHGNEKPNTLAGTRFGDLIRGRGGNDVIRGLAGADCLEGNGGGDRIVGGPGADHLQGGSGRNRLMGGSGNDVIRARNGRADRVVCGKGRRDVAQVDFEDAVGGCESVSRG